MALSHFSDVPRAYSAHPFVVSGSCKREDVLSQKCLLETARDVLADKKDVIGGRLYCITSGGDSRRRRATCLLTLTDELESSDPLRRQLGELRLFNYKCGPDQSTGDIEYKHLLKRLRNSLLRSLGCTINGSLINQEILRHHLSSTGLDKHRINAIISPNDKQDVKLMYDLISAIAVLPPAKEDESPPVHNTRNALRLLGKLYTHILEAYTNVALSLHDQLQHLSAAAHLILAIYSSDKGGSMPSQTYFDMMTTIKNVYFCIAKTQIDDPDGSFWIILIGTDALENLFGKVRTMIGADTNADQLQLANHIESAAICSQILAENPSWERAPRRLTLKTWRDEAGDISAKIDHINPASWKGNVKVKSIVLLTCWEGGRHIATKELEHAGYEPPFEAMDAGQGFDMFCPFGKWNMVLLGRATEGEREEDEEEIEMATAPQIPSEHANSSLQPILPTETETCTSDSIEELAEQELAHLNGGTSTSPKHDAYVFVNSQSGGSVQQHKSSVCRVYSQPLTVRDSRLRLERVRGFPRGPDSTSAETFGVSPGDSPEPFFSVQDPGALLVRSKEMIWLAVVEIYGIKQSGNSVTRLPTRLLGEPNIRITVRITCLSQRVTPNGDGDWEWFGSFEKMTTDVEGRWIQLLDPAIIQHSRNEQVVPGYGFHSAELVAVASLLYGNLRSDLDRFPSAPWTDSFPYRLPNGRQLVSCI